MIIRKTMSGYNVGTDAFNPILFQNVERDRYILTGPVFGVSEKASFKPVSLATETS